jgi:hypothetical protein
MARFALVLLIALAASFSLLGCGPVMSTYLIISAQAELDGAKAADGEKYAVYEYTAASEYLAKAREEQGYADFGPSIDYGFKANELAVQARERAESERNKERAPDTLPPGMEPDVTVDDDDEGPSVIIEKAPQAEEAGEPTKVKIVPITPEEGTRPPE